MHMQAHARATVAVSRALQDFAKALQDTRTAGAACVNLEAYIVESGLTLGVLSEAGVLTLLAKLAKSPVSLTYCKYVILLQQELATLNSKACICIPLLQPGTIDACMASSTGRVVYDLRVTVTVTDDHDCHGSSV